MYMYNNICINEVFCSKPIYSTNLIGFSIFKCIKNVYRIKNHGMKLALNKLFGARSFYTIKPLFVMGLPYITNFLITNTVINHGCKRNSRTIIFSERGHVFFHKRVCMHICTDCFFVLSTFSQCTLKSSPRLTYLNTIILHEACRTLSINLL